MSPYKSSASTLSEGLNRPQTLSGMILAGRFVETDENLTADTVQVDPRRYMACDARRMDGYGDMTRDEIVGLLDRHGFRPATLEELLAYCAEEMLMPVVEEFRDARAVIALGTVVKVCGESLVPCIFTDEDGDRHLWLIYHGDWEADSVYLYFLKPGDEGTSHSGW